MSTFVKFAIAGDSFTYNNVIYPERLVYLLSDDDGYFSLHILQDFLNIVACLNPAYEFHSYNRFEVPLDEAEQNYCVDRITFCLSGNTNDSISFDVKYQEIITKTSTSYRYVDLRLHQVGLQFSSFLPYAESIIQAARIKFAHIGISPYYSIKHAYLEDTVMSKLHWVCIK